MLSPLKATRWNRAAAAHLANRAGFGATPGEMDRLLAMGLHRAVSHYVDYDRVEDPAGDPDWVGPDPERLERTRELQRLNRQIRQASQEERKALEAERRQLQRTERRQQQERLGELRQWWLKRMVKSARPLQEKLVLFWHGHFATSFVKVRDAVAMWRQNEVFRRHALGPWLQLLSEVSKDPAMLVWLDQAQSRKQHPNENFAREVMELFVLGEGHYTEQDVGEAARALTGWSLNRVERKYEYRPRTHDSGVKTVLGQTGNWNGDDVLRILVEQPEAARFLCSKFWRFFASETPRPEIVESLAKVMRQRGGDLKPVLRTLFESEAFYAPEVIRAQVKSPAQWLVGTTRLLERELPPARWSNGAMQQLGQELFAPPNVKGWDGGTAWITTNSLLMRYNLATVLVLGREALPLLTNDLKRRLLAGAGRRSNAATGNAVDVTRLFSVEERRNRDRLMSALADRFIQARLRPKQATALRDYLETQSRLDDRTVLHAVRLVLCTPDYQLA